jgi:hypothetical protein
MSLLFRRISSAGVPRLMISLGRKLDLGAGGIAALPKGALRRASLGLTAYFGHLSTILMLG